MPRPLLFVYTDSVVHTSGLCCLGPSRCVRGDVPYAWYYATIFIWVTSERELCVSKEVQIE